MITTFALDYGATIAVNARVLLAHTVVGATPTDYRVSARGDFAGASWHAYERRPMLQGWESLTTRGCEVAGTTRKLTLYFQVRATLGDSVRVEGGQRLLAPISVESNVLADSICIARRP